MKRMGKTVLVNRCQSGTNMKSNSTSIQSSMLAFFLCPGCIQSSDAIGFFKDGPTPASYSFIFVFSYKFIQYTAGFELGSSEQKARMLTTRPPPRHVKLLFISVKTKTFLAEENFDLQTGLEKGSGKSCWLELNKFVDITGNFRIVEAIGYEEFVAAVGKVTVQKKARYY